MTAAAPSYIVLLTLSGVEAIDEGVFSRQQVIERIDPGQYWHTDGYYNSQFDGNDMVSIRELRPDGTWSDVTQELCQAAQNWIDDEPARIAAEAHAIRQRVYDSVVAAERREVA